MKKITLFLLLVAFAVSSFAQKADSVDVTFNVDFKPFIESPYDTVPFDPENDTVYISGDFADWSVPGDSLDFMLTDADDDSIYTITRKLEVNSTYYYKFAYVPADTGSTWDYADFAGFDNRELELGDSDTTLNKAFSHFPYELTVKDGEQDTVMPGATVMFEDESYTTNNDGKIERLLLHDSLYHYTIKADNGFIDKEMELDFGHFPEKDTVSLDPLYVTFKLNMKEFADTSSDFNYEEDSVYISGGMVDWSEPGTNGDALMEDADGDSIFTTTLQVDSGSYAYKYFYVPAGEGSSWEYGEWDGGDNRTIDIPNKPTTVDNMWGTNETMYDVSFAVTDTNGVAIEDAEIMFGDNSVMTYSSGEASFGVTEGDYDYMVSKEYYDSDSGSLTVDKDTTIEVELVEMVPVTFSVTDTGETAIEAATVVFADDTLTTDANGEVMKYVLGGEYDWKVMAESYVSDSGTVLVEEATSVDVELDIQEYTVTFNVADEDGNPVDEATVTVGDASETTLGDGVVQLDFQNGDYDYTATADGYEDASGSFTVDGADMSVDVTMTSTETAINNPLTEALRVYPNPSNGNVTLQGENIKGAQVSIYNSIGKSIKQVTLKDNRNHLNLEDLKSGVYFIKVEDNKHEAVRKVLIK